MATVSREEIQKAVELVSVAMPKRPTAVFHESARIEVSGGRLRITGTDGAVFASRSIDCAVGDEWLRCVKTDALTSSILQGNADSVSFEVQKNAVVVRCGGARVELPTLNDDAVPDVPEISGRKITADPQKLLDAIERTEFATNVAELSNIRESVWIGCGDDPASVAATDSYILAVYRMPLEGECPGVLVPRSMCGIVKKICALSTGSIEITVAESGTAKIESADSVVVISTHGTQYCKYSKVIESAPDKWVCVSAGELLQALDGCLPFARKGLDRVRLECRNAGNALKLCVAACGHTGSSFATGFDVEPEGSGGFAIILNRRYLHDAVKGCRTDKVNLYIEKEIQPVAVRPHGDAESYVCVIAPMEFSEWAEQAVNSWFEDAKDAVEK